MTPEPWKRLHTALSRSQWGMGLIVLSVELGFGGEAPNTMLKFDLLPDFVGWWIIAVALGSILDLSREVAVMRRLAWGLVVVALLGIFNFTYPPPPESYKSVYLYQSPSIPNETLQFIYSMRDMVGWAMFMLLVWKALRLTQQIAERNGAEELAQQASFRRKFFCGGQLVLMPLIMLALVVAPVAVTLVVGLSASVVILIATICVWLHLRDVANWAESNASAGATWFELWDGEEIEMAEQSQSNPWSFRISTLLLASALVAAIFSHWTLSRKLADQHQERLKSEATIDAYRRQLEILPVVDREKIFVKRIPAGNENQWEWSVFVPKNVNVVWRSKLNDVVWNEIPASCDEQIQLQPGFSLLIANADLEKGILTMTVKPRPGQIGGYHPFIQDEMTRDVFFDGSAWDDSRSGSGLGAYDHEFGLSPEAELPLSLWHTRFGAVQVGNLRSSTPGPGVTFWLDLNDSPQ